MEKQNRVIKSNNQDEIDLKDVWKIVIKRKYYIVLITLRRNIFGYFLCLYKKKPTYEAKPSLKLDIIAVVMVVAIHYWKTLRF